MVHDFFENIFGTLQTPVLVCAATGEYPIAYNNQGAWLLLRPMNKEEMACNTPPVLYLHDFIRFENDHEREQLFGLLEAYSSVQDFSAIVTNAEGRRLSVGLMANLVELEGEKYCVTYIYEAVPTDTSSAHTMPDTVLHTSFHIASSTDNIDKAITKILAHIGAYVHASRAYVFEPASEKVIVNTYEWCAPGVEPMIQELQELERTPANYDNIISRGMFVSNDIRLLPEADGEVLALQGIKSLAILPFSYMDEALGYVGFDDCENYRVWSSAEVQILKGISSILASLIGRRKVETRATRSREVMQLISNTLENPIYVSNKDTYELLFVNQAISNSVGLPISEMIGKPCYSVLQRDMEGPCSFCPLKKMISPDGEIISNNHTWEFKNTITGRWYIVRDSLIKWLDGSIVHMESATDITYRKEYEDQLKYYASTDMMTGVRNREWGLNLMVDMVTGSYLEAAPVTLVFTDLDGLKYVNDTFGHDTGDDMIISTVNILNSCVRRSDIVFRWGGDEFLMLLFCDTAVAEKIMQSVLVKIDEFNQTANRPFKLGLSYGIVALTPGGRNTLDNIISTADALMYQNKQSKCEKAKRDSAKPKDCPQ